MGEETGVGHRGAGGGYRGHSETIGVVVGEVIITDLPQSFRHFDLEHAYCFVFVVFLYSLFLFLDVFCSNDFSAMVAEEYLSLFDFKGKTLDEALRYVM